MDRKVDSLWKQLSRHGGHVIATFEEYQRSRAGDWRRLRDLSSRRGLAPAEIVQLAAVLRATSADLATARERYAGQPVADELELLVAAGRRALAQTSRRFEPARWGPLVRARLAADTPSVLVVTTALLLGLAAGLVWARASPSTALGLLSVGERRAIVASDVPAAAGAVLAMGTLAAGLLAGVGSVLLAAFVGVRYAVVLSVAELTPLVGLDLVALAGVVLLAAEGLQVGRTLLRGSSGWSQLQEEVAAGLPVVVLGGICLAVGSLRLMA